MADDADGVNVAEITPDDFLADEQPAKVESPTTEEPKTETAPEEVKSEEQAKEEPEDKTEEALAPSKDEPEAEKSETTEPEVPKGKAEERKAQLNMEIRDLVAKRNELKASVEKANAEVYQPATETELEEQGLTTLEAKVEAMRQQAEMDKYNNQVAEAQLTIAHESNKVLTDFPIFNPNSDEYDEELATEAAELLRANLVIDPNTQQVIGSNVSPYQLYKTFARAASVSATKGQIKGRQDTEQMLANADNATSAAPAKKPADPLADLWSDPL